MAQRIVRWNPVRDMVAMQSAMDRLFEETWRGIETTAQNSLALDVHENDQAYVVTAAVPGLGADDLNITLHEGTLTIAGEFTAPQADDNTRVLLNERDYGKFSRSIKLPQVIDVEAVEATYDNGILTLTLPKLPNAQPRQIPVRANGVISAN
jgi:HSP20 family protein